MKKLFLKVLMVFCLSLSINNAWSQHPAEVMPLADQSLIMSIAKVGTSLLMVGERGHVLKSKDEGKTWRQIENIPVDISLTKVVAVNNHVWAVGHDATIIHSADAGETWELQFYDPDREVPFLSAYFTDEQTGFVIGAYGTILSTTDSGKNWQDDLIDEELDYHLNDITQGNDGAYYVAAEAGYFFKSVDDGETWQAIELPYMGSMFGVVALDDSVVLYGLRGNILVSEDQGETWQEVYTDVTNNLFGSSMMSDHKILMVGANGARLVYADQSVEIFPGTDSGDDYADVLVIGNQAILVGETGYKSQSIGQ
ncbi:MAG: WD40/YVTN/BNR-like repeat-containing protein [Marinicella sp.]